MADVVMIPTEAEEYILNELSTVTLNTIWLLKQAPDDLNLTFPDICAIEADFTGYTPQSTTFSTATLVGDVAVRLGTAVTFTCTGTHSPAYSVYAYAIIYNLGGSPTGYMACAVQPFSTPQTVSNNGDTIIFTPELHLRDISV